MKWNGRFFWYKRPLFVALAVFFARRGVRFRKEEQLLKAEEEVKRKMEGADARRKEHRRGIVRKANDANSKVHRRCRSWRTFREYAGVLSCSSVRSLFL